MIVARQKTLEDIYRMIDPYARILIVGCGTCMTVCDAGGEREVSLLKQAMALLEKTRGNNKHSFVGVTIKRQCDPEFVDLLKEKTMETDAVLSLGCGIGAQAIAEKYVDLPVFPGVDTLFLGMTRKQGVWDERCAACGECLLEYTGGICPVTRCTKGLLNGPCAGTKNGKCEANREMDCVWIQIYNRLERLNQLDKMRSYYAPRNYLPIQRPKRITNNFQSALGESHV